jgi:hypothetical protein
MNFEGSKYQNDIALGMSNFCNILSVCYFGVQYSAAHTILYNTVLCLTMHQKNWSRYSVVLTVMRLMDGRPRDRGFDSRQVQETFLQTFQSCSGTHAASCSIGTLDYPPPRGGGGGG